MQKFNYVIARFWRDDKNHQHLPKDHDSLCVYTYGSAVHYGTLEEAKNFARAITERAGDGRIYKPFVIDPTPIEDYEYKVECEGACETPEACRANGFCRISLDKWK